MSWEAIAAIGQVLGSIAVLISIAYLALQVRHARDAVGRSTQQTRTDLNVRLMMNRASDETLRRSIVKLQSALGATRHPFVDAAMKQAGLTEEEAFGLLFEQWAWWAARSQTTSNLDQLSAGERAETDRTARFIYGTNPLGRLWFQTQRGMLNPETVSYVDNLLAQPVEGTR
jgi:hypothetical protein